MQLIAYHTICLSILLFPDVLVVIISILIMQNIFSFGTHWQGGGLDRRHKFHGEKLQLVLGHFRRKHFKIWSNTFRNVERRHKFYGRQSAVCFVRFLQKQEWYFTHAIFWSLLCLLQHNWRSKSFCKTTKHLSLVLEIHNFDFWQNLNKEVMQ